jgi:hypothetical protein
MEDPTKDKEPCLKHDLLLKKYKNVFGELSIFPPKRYIDFSIYLMLGSSLVSKNPYRMSTLELKELHM